MTKTCHTSSRSKRDNSKLRLLKHPVVPLAMFTNPFRSPDFMQLHGHTFEHVVRMWCSHSYISHVTDGCWLVGYAIGFALDL